jgi:hypothetical protein
MSDIDYDAVFARSNRANPSDIEGTLWWYKREGHIQDFEKVKVGGSLRWKVTVQKTRYQNYHHPDAPHPTILLTSREMLAFIEGLWVGMGHEPTTRAGHSYGPSTSTVNRRLQGQYAERRRREAEEDEPQEEGVEVVDITDQQEIPEATVVEDRPQLPPGQS